MKQSNELPSMICGACNKEFEGTEAMETINEHMRTEHNSPEPETNTDSASLPQSNPDTLELKNFAEKFDLSLTQARDILAWAESLVPRKKMRIMQQNELTDYQKGFNEAIKQFQENIKRYKDG